VESNDGWTHVTSRDVIFRVVRFVAVTDFE
jgi:hypothetical protein